jgi:hypothetical protein
MNNKIDVLDIFKAKYPSKDVKAVYDCSDEYIVCAVEFDGDCNNTYYSVDKTNGHINVFNPAGDIDRFYKAMAGGSII